MGRGLLKEYKPVWSLLFSWVFGELLLFGLLHVLALPMILREESLFLLAKYWTAGAAVLAVLGICAGALMWTSQKKARGEGGFSLEILPEDPKAETEGAKRTARICWAIFALLFLAQMVLAFVLTYRDGDDAFYVSTATQAATSGYMYRGVAYTGSSGELNLRYSMAPFPMYLSILSFLSGVPCVTIAHVAVPPVLMSMTTALYALVGRVILKKRADLLPLFLIFVQVLIFFGNTSVQTPENFLVARSRQGKAALANLVLPMLLFLIYLLLERMGERRKKSAFGRFPLLLPALAMTAVTLSACLCSVLGTALSLLLLGVSFVCSAVMYRSVRHLPAFLLAALPPVADALLYLYLV